MRVCLVCMRSPIRSSCCWPPPQPRPAPCAARSIAHGVIPTRWGARRIRTAPATRGARHGAAAASASFAAATTSATATADLDHIVSARPALLASATNYVHLHHVWLGGTISHFYQVMSLHLVGFMNSCTHQRLNQIISDNKCFFRKYIYWGRCI